jgi:hypothetical protein
VDALLSGEKRLAKTNETNTASGYGTERLRSRLADAKPNCHRESASFGRERR